MKKLCLAAAAFLFIFWGCSNEEDLNPGIRYDVRFPNAAHNEAEITLTVQNLTPGPVDFAMSRTSPGRYALHEFAKNVYNVRAENSKGDTLQITRPDLHNWMVSKHDGTIRFSYTLYADHADGTYSGINREHAHLNMPATFVWTKNFKDEPITVRFHPPANSNWKVASQLVPSDSANTFTAPDFYYFMDSPTELSNFDMTTWSVPADTTSYTMRLALHHNGTKQQLDDYTEMAKKVVAEEIAVYGEPAEYDYGTYTFIADYLPYVFGDGMEHRNSTILTSTNGLKNGAMNNLGTLSHEFFHSWSVERIRPKSIEPFNFTEANMSGALWFAEGFTSYYDDLMIRRAGLTNNQQYAEGWGGTLNYVLNSPGSTFYSPVEMSRQAPFVDAATSIDQQNKSNTFISYYSWGSMLGLGLDLTLRSEFEGITLDDYMRAMWKKYGKTEKPYTLSDLESTLAEVTDNSTFAQNFFDEHIYGRAMVDYKSLLAKAGFALQKENPGAAVISLGEAKIDFEKSEPTISANTRMGSPLYKAGLDRDDKLISMGGQKITNARDLQRMLTGHAPGDSLSIRYESLGKTYEGTIVLAEEETLQMVPYEKIGKKVTSEMKEFRENWLESKAK